MAFKGLIAEIPIGTDGLTGTKNLSRLRPSQLLKAPYITYENGTVQKEGGTVKYNTATLGTGTKILGGWDWWPTDGVQRMIVYTSAGKILKDTGAGTFPTTLASGLGVPDFVPVFVEGGKEAAAGNRKLFCFNGKNAVRVLAADGATMTTLATPPADWTGGNQPVTGLIHEDRLWGAGNLNDGHRWYYSKTTDHEDLTGAGSGSVAVFPGEGERIIAGASLKGVLVTWKFPFGVYLVDTTDPTVANWKVSRLSRSAGIASPLAFAALVNDLLFWDRGGSLDLLSAVEAFGSLGITPFTTQAELDAFIRENTNAAQVAKIQAIAYHGKQRAEFAVAGIGATKNTSRLIAHFTQAGQVLFSFSDFVTAESLWLRKDTNNIPRPVAGDEQGFVRRLDQDSRTHDGAGYQGEFQTAHTDLSHVESALGTRRKEGHFLELVVEPKGNWNLNADILWDGAIKQTVTFNLGQTGAGLDSFVLDTDVLAGDQVLNKKRRIVAGGRRFSVVGRNNGSGQDFSAARFFLHFHAGDERVT